MSALRNALAGGLMAAAGSASKSIDESIAEDRRIAEEQRRFDYNERLKKLDEEAVIRAEDRKVARARSMGQEIDAGARGIMQGDAAKVINANLGSSIDPNDPESQRQLQAILDNPAAAEAYKVATPDEITRSAARAEAARRGGFMDAAREEDTNRRNLETVKHNKERGDRDDRRLDQAEERNQRNFDRQMSASERAAARDADRAEKADKQSKRAAADSALRSIDREIGDLRKEAGSLDTSEARKSEIAREIGQLNGQRSGLRKQLGESVEFDMTQGTAPKIDAPPIGTERVTSKGDIVVYQGGDWKSVTSWKPKGKFDINTITQPVGGTSATPKADSAATPRGLMADDPVERLGQAMEQAKAELSASSTPPPARQPQALEAWRQRRAELAAKYEEARKAYETALGPQARAFMGQ